VGTHGIHASAKRLGWEVMKAIHDELVRLSGKRKRRESGIEDGEYVSLDGKHMDVADSEEM